MTTPQTKPPAIAQILAPGRRGPFAGLVSLGLLESLALASIAFAVEAALAPAGETRTQALVALAALGAAAAGLSWARMTAAEDFGMRYVNDLRIDLARHAVASAGAGRPRRLGAVSVRLTSDLTALRDWAAVGVSDLVAGAAAAGASLFILAQAGQAGLAGGAAVFAVQALLSLALWRPLSKAHETLRRARGRVSAMAGDIVLAAPALAQFRAGAREARRLAKRSDALRAAAVRRRALAAWAAAPAAAALAIGVLAAASTGGAIVGMTGLVLGLGFAGAASAAFARALDMALASKAARARMTALAGEAADADRARAAAPETALPQPASGEIVLVRGEHAGAACLAVEAMAEQARSRRLVSPSAPLIRASIRRNLALRRPKASDAALERALALAGLDPSAWPLDRRLDPALHTPDLWTQSRLRLARAIAHGGKAIFVAEPALLHEPDYEELLRAACQETGAAVVAASL